MFLGKLRQPHGDLSIKQQHQHIIYRLNHKNNGLWLISSIVFDDELCNFVYLESRIGPELRSTSERRSAEQHLQGGSAPAYATHIFFWWGYLYTYIHMLHIITYIYIMIIKTKYIVYSGIYIIMHIQASFLPLSKLDAHLSMHLGMLEVADNEVYHLWMEGGW